MSYLFSKILGFLILPSNLLFGFLALGVFLYLFRRFSRFAAFMIVGSAIGFAICGLSPAANWLILPLENRFPKDPLPDGVDGIIVLGGAVDTVVTGGRGETALTTSGERVTIVARLAQKYPDAKVIHSGGKGLVISGQASEAEGVQRLFTDFGIAAEMVILEDKSRNTWENAVLTKELVKPAPGQSWLLVTSAYHMPRSVGAFRAAGWTGISAYPVDYRTRGDVDRMLWFSSLSSGLRRFDIAFREWVGLCVYALGGKSSSVFPAP